MDCSAEEQLIKLTLQPFTEVKSLEFDLPKRQLTVFHAGGIDAIDSALQGLNFGSTKIETTNVENAPLSDHRTERKLLWIVLLINFAFFAVELITGFVSNSMGLVADSLDMLADAIVYGMSLYAVGKLTVTKKRIARLSGYFQMVLAILGFFDVLRRFLGYEEVPGFRTMIGISALALIGNAACLILLQRSKSQEAHMKASMIFTSNDVLVNLGVIIAGVAVYLFNSKYPDLIIGTLVFALVSRGAVRILKLSR